ncbi:hypothetical protein AgCh_028641 [Apium graveolens]
MSRFKFVTDVMLILLGGYDMVRGVQWLSTLGNVNWDFKSLLMEFIVGEKKASNSDNSVYPGLLQPLPVPEDVWVDISKDSGLPKFNGKKAVDRSMQKKELLITDLKRHFTRAQERMKYQAGD